MKKKFVLVSFLIVILVAGLFTFTGCGNKKEESTNNVEVAKEEKKDSNHIVVKDVEKKGHTALFDNNKDFITNDDFSDVTVATILDNTTLGVEMNMFITECSKSDFEEFRRTIAKEYIWNNFKGFTYEDNSSAIKFVITLVDNGNSLIVLKGSCTSTNLYDRTNDIKDLFDSKDIQELLSSIQYVN